MTDPKDVLRQLWLRNRDLTISRLEHVREALDRLARGELSETDREKARGEAHRLRGILGTYGFPEGSVLAGDAEDVLADGDHRTTPSQAAELGARLGDYGATL